MVQLIVTQPVNKFLHFMESERSVPRSQEPTTGPYPKSHDSSPHSHAPTLFRNTLTLSSLCAYTMQMVFSLQIFGHMLYFSFVPCKQQIIHLENLCTP